MISVSFRYFTSALVYTLFAVAGFLFLPVAIAQSSENPSRLSIEKNVPLASHSTGRLVVTSNDVLAELSRASEGMRESVLSKPDAIQQLLSNLMIRRLLAEEAEHDGLDKELLVAASVAIARDRILSDARLVRLDTQNNPSDADLEAYAKNLYSADASRFDQPAQTRVRHILLENKGSDSIEKAKSLLEQLRVGASFEEMAKKYSTDVASAAKGGDLGFFTSGQMVLPFEDAVNALTKPGELSEPVTSQFGFHLIRLEERREKSRQSYEEVRLQLISAARTAILSNVRIQKVQSLSKEISFSKDDIEAFVKSFVKK